MARHVGVVRRPSGRRVHGHGARQPARGSEVVGVAGTIDHEGAIDTDSMTVSIHSNIMGAVATNMSFEFFAVE